MSSIITQNFQLSFDKLTEISSASLQLTLISSVVQNYEIDENSFLMSKAAALEDFEEEEEKEFIHQTNAPKLTFKECASLFASISSISI